MKILLVEDSRILRERLRGLINAIPNAFVAAETDNEEEARGLLLECRPDLVVLDLRLRGGSGLSVLEHIKASYPSITVVVLTNYGHAEYRTRCMELGANYFLDKTSDIETFSELLTELSRLVPAAAQA